MPGTAGGEVALRVAEKQFVPRKQRARLKGGKSQCGLPRLEASAPARVPAPKVWEVVSKGSY